MVQITTTDVMMFCVGGCYHPGNFLKAKLFKKLVSYSSTHWKAHGL